MTITENIHRLCVCKSIDDSQACLDLFAKFFWKVIEIHTQESVKYKKDHEAKLMLQMMFTKILHLKEILNGVSYNSKEVTYLNTIIDPGVMAIMSRNIYETAALFNLIYRQPKTSDQQDIIYNLWRHAGLRMRQGYKDSFEATDRQNVVEDEKQNMESLSKLIKANSYFRSLDKHNQNKILKRLDRGEFLIQFVDNKVKVFKWHQLIDVMDLKKDLFDKIYSYFSLYIHPSNVSVSQFDELFSKTEQGYLEMSSFNIKTTLCMIGVFIADYINYFPKIGDVYNSLDIEERVVIDFHNMLARGEWYSIIESENN